jgi:hypothetical protein
MQARTLASACHLPAAIWQNHAPDLPRNSASMIIVTAASAIWAVTSAWRSPTHSATTTPPRMAPALATTCTSYTWQRHIDVLNFPVGTSLRVNDVIREQARFNPSQPSSLTTVNLGAGEGYSVPEKIAAFEKSSGGTVPHHFTSRCRGEVAGWWEDRPFTSQLLYGKATRGVDAMCAEAWRWRA